MIAAALMLAGLSASDAQAEGLKRALEPRWVSAADAPPIAFRYRGDTGALAVGGARLSAPLSSTASLFMQVRKQKDDADLTAAHGAVQPRGRTLSVGMSLRW